MILFRKICLFMLLGMFVFSFAACGAEKEANERRNYMMPKTSELPRNSMYKEKAKKKTHKAKASKKRKAKKLF
jgi:hypothetical protein